HSRRCAVRTPARLERARARSCASGPHADSSGSAMNDRHASLRNLDLGPGKEFDLVRTLLTEWGNSAQRIGDDAAVLDVPPGARLPYSARSSVEIFQRERRFR